MEAKEEGPAESRAAGPRRTPSMSSSTNGRQTKKGGATRLSPDAQRRRVGGASGGRRLGLDCVEEVQEFLEQGQKNSYQGLSREST